MKRKKKIKVPAYKFGIDGSMLSGNIKNNIGGAVQGGVGMLTSAFSALSPSTASTQQQVVAQSINDTLGGAASGAQLGMAVGGPLGAAVGAGAGLITGAIGKKGGIEQTAGFTTDNEYSLSTGLRGLFGNKKLKRKIRRDKDNVQANKIAVANTAELQSDWDQENNYDTYVFDNGGELPSSPAYVDDGELIQTPTGDIMKVPEQGNPTDANLVNLPEGSRILSDSLKVPGTNKTFAQLGEKMMTKRKSKGKDKYAENAAKLNEMNNNIAHDMLFDLQEQVKSKKGIKPKTKSYAVGGYTTDLTGDLNKFYESTGQGIMPTLKTPNLNSYLLDMPESTSEASISTKSNRTFNNIADIAGSISSLAPVISNMFPGKTETVAPEYNMYNSTIAKTMRNRRYNITPALNAINKNRVISNYNASQMNTNTGANLAYRLQTANQADRNYQDLYSQASNIQAQYDADYANTLNSLGQQRVQANNMAKDINARNRAANRNIRRTGLSQLSEWAQNQALMSNKKKKDYMLLPFMENLLSQGYTEDVLNRLKKHLR